MSTSDASTEGQEPVAGISTVRFLVETGIAGTVAALVEPSLIDLGLRLVRVRMGGSGDAEGTLNLQIMCERPDGSMTIEDCERASRQLSPLLDASEPIQAAYRLEVSSPGIDRPLVRPSDFDDWAGYEARVELTEPVNGRKRFKGIVDGFEDGEARIACDLGELGVQVLGFPVSLIGDAKLMLTDDLVRETLRRVKKSTETAKGRNKASSGAKARAKGRAVAQDVKAKDVTAEDSKAGDLKPGAGSKRTVED